MIRNVTGYRAILAVMLVFPIVARAGLSTVQLGPAGVVDTWIWSGDELSHGDQDTLYVNDMVSCDQRILIKFTDLTPLTGAKTITSATLGLFLADAAEGSLTLEVHRITGSWGEDVTWSARPGFEDPAVTSSLVTAIYGDEAYDPYRLVTWNVTSLVQKWVVDNVENDGMAIYGEGTPGYQLYVSSENVDGLPLPRLDVTFVPVPAPAGVLLGFLGLGVSGLKLRKFV